MLMILRWCPMAPIPPSLCNNSNKEKKVIRRIDRSGGIGKRRANNIFYDVIQNSELIFFFVKCIYRKVKIDFISFSIPTENDFSK